MVTSIQAAFQYITLNNDQLERHIAIEWLDQAARMILNTSKKYHVRMHDILEVKDHMVQLPSGTKKVEVVMYMRDDAKYISDKEANDICSQYSEETGEDCPTCNEDNITRIIHQSVVSSHRYLFGSSFFKERFTMMRPADRPFHQVACEYCPTTYCDETYKLDPLSNTITTSFKDGYICIAYQSYGHGDDGYLLVPDNPVILQAMASYVEMMFWKTKFHTTEANSYNKFLLMEQRWANLYTHSKSIMQLKGLDIKALERIIYKYQHIMDAPTVWSIRPSSIRV